jgi:DNA mismatch repair enzyme (predicted ATPase)
MLRQKELKDNYMEKRLIDSIYYYYEENTSYGLKILIKYQGVTKCLFFDSSKFVFLEEIELSKNSNYNWRKINYEELKNQVHIVEIKEDELVSYFIKLSNNDIFYIFQRIDSLEKWEQDFEIINENSLRYSEVEEYMNESWIDQIELEN